MRGSDDDGWIRQHPEKATRHQPSWSVWLGESSGRGAHALHGRRETGGLAEEHAKGGGLPF